MYKIEEYYMQHAAAHALGDWDASFSMMSMSKSLGKLSMGLGEVKRILEELAIEWSKMSNGNWRDLCDCGAWLIKLAESVWGL